MPLSADNFVQENTGTLTTPGTSCVVSLPSGTTAGNTVVVFLTSGTGWTPPAGFVQDKAVSSSLYAFRKSGVAASETSWTFTAGAANTAAWYVAEVANVDMEPLDASASSSFPVAGSNGGTLSSGTTPLNAGLNTVVFAMFAVDGAGTSSWSGYTNGFEEVADVGSGTGVTYQAAVARKFVTGTTGTFSSTATLATSLSAPNTGALIVAYRAADSPIVAPLAGIFGAEVGTHGGATASTGTGSLFGSTLAPVGTWGTTYLIQAASARASGYGLRLVRSAAAGAVRIGSFVSRVFSAGMNVRVVSGSGVVSVASGVESNGLNRAGLLKYDFSTNKFGVQAGASTAWQNGTTPLNTWVWVEWRLSPPTGSIDWRLETAADTYTDQPAVTATPSAGTDMVALQLGAGTGTTDTATIDYDDVVVSPFLSAYPLGPHKVLLLVPDVAATVGYSGTPGNFAIVANNATSTALAGSGGAITTSGVAGRLDEVPPTISASADGVVQTATAASDYLQFPMTDPTVADDEVVAGVRMLAALISTTGAGAGDLAIRGWDGTTETALASVSQVTPGNPTAVSTTAPRWLCAMWQMANGWTAAKLAAAALRLGYSGDATPDMGAEVLYLEYATRKAVTRELFGDQATQEVNPNTEGIRSVVVDAPADQDLTLNWEVSGTPDSAVVPAGTSHTEVLDAADAAEVGYVEVVSENEPPPGG